MRIQRGRETALGTKHVGLPTRTHAIEPALNIRGITWLLISWRDRERIRGVKNGTERAKSPLQGKQASNSTGYTPMPADRRPSIVISVQWREKTRRGAWVPSAAVGRMTVGIQLHQGSIIAYCICIIYLPILMVDVYARVLVWTFLLVRQKPLRRHDLISMQVRKYLDSLLSYIPTPGATKPAALPRQSGVCAAYRTKQVVRPYAKLRETQYGLHLRGSS